MYEWHQISQENEIPRTAPAFASSELATVGSISAPPGSLSARASHSALRLHVVLAAIASITAIAFLVFFCVRVYEGRAVHGLRRRRLASSEDESASVQVCGVAADDEEEQQRQRSELHKASSGKEAKVAFKGRLTRPTGVDDGGDKGNPQQQDDNQQGHLHETATATVELGLPEDRSPRGQDQPGFSPFSDRSPLPSTEAQTPAGLGAPTELHGRLARWRTSGHVASGTRREAALEAQQLQQELWHLQVQLQRKRLKYQELQLRLQQQQEQDDLYRQQQQQHLHWLNLRWQRLRWQQQQHYLQQQSGQTHSMQRQDEQQHHRPSAFPFLLSPAQVTPWPGHPVSSPLPVDSSLPSTHVRSPEELDAATGLLNLLPQQHAAEHFPSETRQTVPMYGRPLRRQTQRKQRKLRLELTRIQRQLRRRVHREQQLLWQLQQQQAQLQQQQRDQRKLEQEYAHWRHLFWQQQLQQQSLLQQQVHHHLTQRPEQHDWLQQKEQAQLLYAQGYGERQESMQEGEQQVTPQEERERRRETAKGKQEEHGDPELWEDEERQLLQPTGPLSGPFLEDEWIASDFSKHVATQPNTSQQASQASAVAVTARPLISEGSVMAVFPGYPLAPLPKAPAAATAGASEDETAAAGASGAAVGSAATGLEVHAGGASAAASTTTGGGPGLKMPALSRLDSSGNTEGVVTEIATARTGLSPPPPAATASSHPDSRDMLDSSHAAALEHPFVHLPRPAVSTIPATLFVDLRSAASSRRSTRYIVPLLQEAHDLLSLRVLSLTQLRKLARAASSLVEHAMNHQHQDLSKHATSRAVERLALRFLSLDVVVSTFIVLGQTPDRGLWRTFTDAISHSAPPLTVRGSKEGRYTFFSILGQELSGAIQLLKTGRRPSPGKLIKIKRMLFCSVESPMRLKTPDFDRWRKDDCSNNDEH